MSDLHSVDSRSYSYSDNPGGASAVTSPTSSCYSPPDDPINGTNYRPSPASSLLSPPDAQIKRAKSPPPSPLLDGGIKEDPVSGSTHDFPQFSREPKDCAPKTAEEFSEIVGRSKRGTRVAWEPTFNTTGNVCPKDAERLKRQAKGIGTAPAAPEMELATGFAAELYGQLLQAKRNVHRLNEEREGLVAATRRARRDLVMEERKCRVLLDADACEGAAAKQAPKAARKRIRSACGAVAVTEAARRVACHDRLVNMMRELKEAVDAVKTAHSRRQFHHFEKLTQTLASLEGENRELRSRLALKNQFESAETNRREAERIMQRAHEKDAAVEALKKDTRRVQNAVRLLQEDLRRGRQRLDSQQECHQRLREKIQDTRAKSEEKRASFPRTEQSMRQSLKEMSDYTMHQCKTLKKAKEDCDRLLQEDKARLMRRSTLVDKMQSEYKKREEDLVGLQNKVKEAQKALQGQECSDDNTTDKEARDPHLGDPSDIRQEWEEMEKRLEDELHRLQEQAVEYRSQLDITEKDHQARLRSTLETAADRQAQLLVQLQSCTPKASAPADNPPVTTELHLAPSA